MLRQPLGCGRTSSTWSSNLLSVSRRSPTRARSTWTFLLISDGSISMWIFLRLGGVGLQVAGHAVVEAHAEGQQQVGFLDGVVHPGFAVHAHHAQVERVAGGQAAEAQQGHRHRRIGPLGEFAQLAPSPRSATRPARPGSPAAWRPGSSRPLSAMSFGSGLQVGAVAAAGGSGCHRTPNRCCACWASLAISTSTGPGRPVRAM